MAIILMLAEDIISVPCLVFALRRESMYFCRICPFQRSFSDAPCRAEFRGLWGADAPFRGRSVLMLETGMGASATEAALRWCLKEPRLGKVLFRPHLLISAGFSGALQPGLHVGDLVLATEVVDPQGHCWPATCPPAWAGHGFPAGRVLTMPELVSDPQKKQELGRRYNALAVDMESAVVARLCHQHNLPFACLRVISDDWQTTLPPYFTGVLRQGRISLLQLAAQVLRHPQLIGVLGSLARQTRQAARKLSGPLAAVVLSG